MARRLAETAAARYGAPSRWTTHARIQLAEALVAAGDQVPSPVGTHGSFVQEAALMCRHTDVENVFGFGCDLPIASPPLLGTGFHVYSCFGPIYLAGGGNREPAVCGGRPAGGRRPPRGLRLCGSRAGGGGNAQRRVWRAGGRQRAQRALLWQIHWPPVCATSTVSMIASAAGMLNEHWAFITPPCA